MNWDHVVSWGRGFWVSVSDIGRVGQPEVVLGQPELKNPRKRVSCLFGLGSGSDKITHVW